MDRFRFPIRHPGPVRLTLAAAVIAIVVLNAVASPTPPATGRPATDAELDAWLAHQVDDTGIPGAAWAIVRGGRLAHIGTHGRADATGRPVTADTPFVIGSLSKSLTALAIARLADAGRIDLDAPVVRILPAFRVADPVARATITPRQLLLQTSGLPGDAASLDAPPMSLAARIASFAAVTPVSRPGERYAYSNANYVVLGGIVEAVTGQPFGRAMDDLVFGPLGMGHTTADRTTAERLGLGDAHRLWFGLANATRPLDRPDLAPAGFIAASARDLARPLELLAHDGLAPDGTRFLSAEMVAQVVTGVVPAGPRDARYAFGWLVSTRDGRATLAHDGSTTDMSSFAALTPASGSGIVLLLDGQAIPYELLGKSDMLGFGALDLLAGIEPSGTLERFYPIVDLVMVVILASLLASLARAIGSARHSRGTARVADPGRVARVRRAGGLLIRGYLDVLVPVVLLSRVPVALGAGWPVLVRTDLGLVAMAIVILRLAIGAAHLAGWLGLRRRAASTPRPATLAA
jgi:CubicO group peptidase (beta-lactamase class C family)